MTPHQRFFYLCVGCGRRGALNTYQGRPMCDACYLAVVNGG